MSLTIYGEIAKDILIDSKDGHIEIRNGGAGLYSTIAAHKQGSKVDFFTIYNQEINKYDLGLYEYMGISFEKALLSSNYVIPKYLVKGFKSCEKKVSIPINLEKLKCEYTPELSKESKGLLVFPLNYSIPIDLCREAKEKENIVFLDPKPNEKSIEDAKKCLRYVDILLVNEEESQLITETNTLSEAIECLSNLNLKYVVIKRGDKGCILINEQRKVKSIPAFNSNVKCTLGSGDVFGGVLAANYIENKDIEYSIKIASCAAANFIECNDIELMCDKRTLEKEVICRKENVMLKKVKAYLASPFFSQQELNWVKYIKGVLEEVNIDVFSPFHENGLLKRNSSDILKKEVFDKDIEAIDKSDIIVALLDNNDTGTYFEIGYAYKNEIPIVGLKTSDSNLNNMILNSCSVIVNSVDELIYEVKKYEK